MLNRVVGAVLLCGLTLTGCSALRDSQEPPELDRAEALWMHRTAYVGDNSNVLDLVERSGFGSMGEMTVALQTDVAPYGVTVTYSNIDKPFDAVDFDSQATLLLGLVGNLDRVEVTSGDDTYALTGSGATRQLGFDVKVLGQDEDKLRDYLESLSD